LVNDTYLHKKFAKELEQQNASKKVQEAVAGVITDYQRGLANKSSDKANATNTAATTKPASFVKAGAAKTKVQTLDTLRKQQQILKDLFAHLKGRISGFNKEAREDKTDQESMRKKMSEQLEGDRKKLEQAKQTSPGSFQVERLTNRTRMEERELHYWDEVEKNQHGMFHTNLKVTHGLMARVKDVMEAYSQRLTKGTVDKSTMKAVEQISMPSAFLSIKHSLHLEIQDEREHRKLSDHLLRPSRH